MSQVAATPAQMRFAEEAETTTVHLSGDWSIERGIPATGDLTAQLAGVKRLRFDSTELGAWDTSLLSVIGRLAKAVEADPRDAHAYAAWGWALAQMGKRAEAEEKWSRAIEVDPTLRSDIEGIRKNPPGKE